MSMFDNILFKRFSRASKESGFRYSTEDQAKDYEDNPQVISMEKPGFNLAISVRNFMAEAVMLGANLHGEPTKITSLLYGNIRGRNDPRNSVVIVIHSSEVKLNTTAKTKTVQVRKSEIVIPGNMLNQGSVYVDELDCYITTESNLEATRQLIVDDVLNNKRSETVALPETMVSPDPINLYSEYKHLVDLCIRHQDRIQIRVGYDIRDGTAPESIRNMYFAILDHYFVPFADHKLVFDPTLGEDDFVIQSLHLGAKEEYRYTFSKLAKTGRVYVSHELQNTISGEFYGMAIFANRDLYSAYYYERKCQERFHDEKVHVAARSGDPLLREQIGTLERDMAHLQATDHEKTEELTTLRADRKRLQSEVSERDRTITRLRDRVDAKLDVDVVMRHMDNDAAKIDNDAKKIDNDRVDQEFRAETAEINQKAAWLKSVGDLMKNGWAMVAGCVAGALTVLAVLKKYNVRVTMG